jgi:16S rRNA (cytosine1402-N4)-methyltransferase
LEALDIRPDGVYVDATYGGGGHSRAIVECLDSRGHLYSFDQDDEAVAGAMSDERFTIVYSNFRFLSNFMRYYKVEAVDGILADLGVSFHHFDDSERGFSFRFEGRLDMRMNRKAAHSAAWVLENYSEAELARIFCVYGELKQGRKIAAEIVKHRTAGKPVDTVAGLMEAVGRFISPRKEKKELAMLFQALRIEVNGEMRALEEFLQQTLSVLRPGGRLAVITYHSLEDRMVKLRFKDYCTGCTCPRDIPICVCGKTPRGRLVNRKPIIASEEELKVNQRSRSAKLRAIIKEQENENNG